jgi:hypothetical protein
MARTIALKGILAATADTNVHIGTHAPETKFLNFMANAPEATPQPIELLIRSPVNRMAVVFTRCLCGELTQPAGLANVRFGSKADICAAKSDVRFTPDNDRESGFPHKVMSALPPKADMCSALAHVCFGP